MRYLLPIILITVWACESEKPERQAAPVAQEEVNPCLTLVTTSSFKLEDTAVTNQDTTQNTDPISDEGADPCLDPSPDPGPTPVDNDPPVAVDPVDDPKIFNPQINSIDQFEEKLAACNANGKFFAITGGLKASHCSGQFCCIEDSEYRSAICATETAVEAELSALGLSQTSITDSKSNKMWEYLKLDTKHQCGNVGNQVHFQSYKIDGLKVDVSSLFVEKQ